VPHQIPATKHSVGSLNGAGPKCTNGRSAAGTHPEAMSTCGVRPLPPVHKDDYRGTVKRRALLGLAVAAPAITTLESLARPARASEREIVRLGLAIHIAREASGPVAEEAFVERQVETANRIFAPYAVQFERRERHEGDAGPTRMATRGDRDALGAFVRPHWINVFVVASLLDVDEPERVRRGVHWHSMSHVPTHYVILSRISFDAVLAHELGHFLGNPRHSETVGNLMSYHHTDVLPFLDPPQERRLHQSVAAYLQTGELRRLGAQREAAAAPVK
jgi:hypothetical protein